MIVLMASVHRLCVVCIFRGYDRPGCVATLHIDWTGNMCEYLGTQERVFRLWGSEKCMAYGRCQSVYSSQDPDTHLPHFLYDLIHNTIVEKRRA